ncbi:MAG: site-specific integrase [Rhodocyclaceae bacterium]|nr:site-specific integrase [Rhodocyclaceae bacterium]
MATITSRGKYQWQAKIRMKGFPVQTKTFTTRRDAENWARVLESEMVRGAFISRTPSERITLKQLFDDYERTVTPTKKNEKSEREIIGRLRERFGAHSLAGLHAKEIAGFRDEMLGTGRACSTVKHYLDTLSVVINHAITELHYPLTINPCSTVKRPKQPAGRDRRLMPGELRRLLRECRRYKNPILEPLVLLALETAARQGELFKLRWEDVDLANKTITLRDTKNSETRGVPLSPEAVEVLKGLRPVQDKNVMQLPRGRVLQANVAATRIAFIRAMARARARYERVCERAGRKPDLGYLSDLRFHDLRHEATSRLFESGLFDMMEVASITGHKTLSMLKRYTHLQANRLADKMHKAAAK